MKTYESVAAAAADPESNFARNRAKSRAAMAENAKIIAAFMAQGMSREEAWAQALAQQA